MAGSASPILQHPPPPVVILSTTPPDEPPPPYPSRERRQRTVRSGRRRRTISNGQTLPDGYSDYDLASPFLSVEVERVPHHEVTENTPLLAGANPRLPVGGITRRQRTLSLSSTVHSATSFSPSLAQTFISAFRPDRDCDLDPEEATLDSDSDDALDSPTPRAVPEEQQRLRRGRWARYFRPLTMKAYYSALFHLLFLNFPYALVAWIFLFVFTLTGTTTLMALPVGAVLCFLDLIGARAFARGELHLQSTFHHPLSFPIPDPPPPIFTRTRLPTPAEIESGAAVRPQAEHSFYRNAYALFTDSTSYMPLFYFLVLKPPLTVLLSLFLVCIVPLSFALVFPAPAMLRLVRRLGLWQANVAVEGLCYPSVR
ncbi:uncharacterized protein PHACADRAFT_147058 [Phanerochaete carnosa HHB-10118-sp]|uniref:Uncharacterized protein n=1 Tax=Phanerochaete carnosa (strain HHB-10118-sp) TaxID=650164 RepID=K5UXI9_PHACS|nr:uncharacterized protein PHACADRAFT_147058 [Phanerochaete carnosa HHB-10118-sp]EKM54791.1 hypothetical protein PHACADRAFT_147058 [Phanerochaete carnosa HHB-10118-sp]